MLRVVPPHNNYLVITMFLRWIIGGLIGAVVGAIVWVAIGYSMQAEVGYVAWGIGFVCGLCVQLVGGEEDGFLPGIIAVLFATLSILVSKYLVVSLLMGSALSQVTQGPEMHVTDEQMIASTAEEIIAESEEAGKKVKLPDAYYDEDAPTQKQYPSKIWRKAKSKWEKLPAEEREQQKQEREAFTKLMMEEMKGALEWQVFLQSFNPLDLLWFGLAAFTAFRVGSGLVGDDD